MLFSNHARWKTALIGATCLVGLAATAWASPERPDCRWEWNKEWFHHRTTVGHIRWCLQQQHVDINQTDDEGRTLLHRLAVDLSEDREYVESAAGDRYLRGISRKVRRAMVEELLRWDQLNLDAVDQKGRTAWRYMIKRKKNWSTAAKLLKAGASVRLTETDKTRMQNHWVPIIGAVQERVADPFDGEVDISDLADCQTADCLIEEVVPDAE